MQLLQLTLNDFGVYQGQVNFDLDTKNKPIILFAGKNGAGKTTILEAIKLCLYGSRGIGKKITRLDYDNYIRNRIHRYHNAVVPLATTSVSLLFSYSSLNEVHKYEVTRSWKTSSGTLQESLLIKIDGLFLSKIPEDNWQGFIDDMVPPNIIDLFFFDGEKIHDLVVDNFSQQTLASEVKKLLGLNIIEKLQTDLDTYLYRQRKENAVIEHRRRLQEAEAKVQVIDQKYQAKLHDYSQESNRLSNIVSNIEKIERQINQESSGYAFQRESIKNQISRIELEQDIFGKQLQDLSGGLLPFTLVPELCQELKNQLVNEAKIQQWQASLQALRPIVDNLQMTIQGDAFWINLNEQLTLESRNLLTKKFSDLLENLLVTDVDYADIQILHTISNSERLQILGWINEAAIEIPKKIKKLGTQLSYLEDKRQDLAMKLRNIPDDEVLKPLVEKLNELTQIHSKVKESLDKFEHEKNMLSIERDEALRQLRKAFEQVRTAKRIEERIALVEKTQSVLIEYQTRMTEMKISELENHILNHFTSLLRKPDLVYRIEIDPGNFEIRLYDRDDNFISKDLLSAGEKQIFAISLLWALRELSGKDFPVIIDTPLGRLDNDHREHLINKYFPNVSHQVILFSTDTEIGQDYYRVLEPQVSHSYTLHYDPNLHKTKALIGYSWNGAEDAAE